MKDLPTYLAEAKERFNQNCILTIDGACKYWNPEAFGYAKEDNEAPLDKFFPEQIKQILEKELTQLHDTMREEIAREIEIKCLEMFKEKSDGAGGLKDFSWSDFAVDLSSSIARGTK